MSVVGRMKYSIILAANHIAETAMATIAVWPSTGTD